MRFLLIDASNILHDYFNTIFTITMPITSPKPSLDNSQIMVLMMRILFRGCRSCEKYTGPELIGRAYYLQSKAQGFTGMNLEIRNEALVQFPLTSLSFIIIFTGHLISHYFNTTVMQKSFLCWTWVKCLMNLYFVHDLFMYKSSTQHHARIQSRRDLTSSVEWGLSGEIYFSHDIYSAQWNM